MIRVQCTSCGAKLRAPDEALGKKTKCPSCGALVLVDPGPSAAFDDVLDPEEVAGPEDAYGFEGGGDVGPGKLPSAGGGNGGEARRPCPVCGEMILATAAKCRFCNEILDPKLKKSKKKRASFGSDDEDLSTGDWLVAIICSGIGCILGVVWMIQGKPKGGKMVGVSILANIFWVGVRFVIEAMSNNPGGP